ncbi:putative mfs monocarboxylate transporter protein [Botrytis fragariae]|uniref:Putative mfs monocarboxylate transporter protein n=1 Tax=Botrytis fragariae TaxID=1964551 RepID=A0A8H6B368_9HELO|nr:putative mfs monocarboxylate transporter protein [Botrytis fragariae]KAF5878167.1 putative mfs monocarboxylate transporter protein [Botrytis fragariae]
MNNVNQQKVTASPPVMPVTEQTAAEGVVEPPPEGGCLAWTQVAMGHLVIFNSMGYISSFGLFQQYYVLTLNRSVSDISWIGSLQLCLLLFIGTFSGRALDGGYFKILLFIGCGLQVIGTFATSFATQYWQILLAQGICTGVGHGLLFCPMISLISTYFSKRRSIAIGLAACGSATGGLVFPAIAYSCLEPIGFPWTVRIMGFVMLANNCFVILLTKTRIAPRASGPWIDLSAFRELPYTLYSIGLFLSLWGVYFAYYYISIFSRDILLVSTRQSTTLLLVINGVGIFGRIIPGLVADRWFGSVYCLAITTFVSGSLIFCWIAIHGFPGLIAWVVFYGLFANAVQALFPAASSTFTTKLEMMGTRLGMVFAVISIACLTGPPIAGALISANNGSFLYAQIFGGCSMLLGSMVMLGSVAAKRV